MKEMRGTGMGKPHYQMVTLTRETMRTANDTAMEHTGDIHSSTLILFSWQDWIN